MAVASRGEARLKRFSERFGVTNTYLDYRKMIDRERPDIVSVTTPTFARAEPIIYAAEHGVKGIYAEKGLCASLEEADRIVAALKRNDVAFNWGTLRRQHDGYRRLRDAIARGEIGEPRFVLVSHFTDLIKHHPHTLDVAGQLLGDPRPLWVEGHLVEPGDALAKSIRRPLLVYDRAGHRFVPPPDRETADPMVGFYRVGYGNDAEACFLPVGSKQEIEVRGTEGRAFAWDNGAMFGYAPYGQRGGEAKMVTFKPAGYSPTVNTIRDIIREIETGERTAGNIDVTMQSVEAQFGLAHSHLQGGIRIPLPVADRRLYIPGG